MHCCTYSVSHTLMPPQWLTIQSNVTNANNHKTSKEYPFRLSWLGPVSIYPRKYRTSSSLTSHSTKFHSPLCFGIFKTGIVSVTTFGEVITCFLKGQLLWWHCCAGFVGSLYNLLWGDIARYTGIKNSELSCTTFSLSEFLFSFSTICLIRKYNSMQFLKVKLMTVELK